MEKFLNGSMLYYLIVKSKLSITLDKETILEIQKQLHTGRFRNKSHLIEYAVRKLLEVENGG